MLNYLDYIILSVMLISVLFGLFRGFVASVLSFVGWIASIYISYILLPYTKEMLATSISSPAVATVAGYMIALFGSLIAFGILNLLLSKVIGGMLMGAFFDKLLGGVFGAMRGAAVISACYLCFVIALNMLDGKNDIMKEDKDSYPAVIKEAYTYGYISEAKEMLVEMLPNSIQSHLEELNKKFSSKSNLNNVLNDIKDYEDKGIESFDDDAAEDVLLDLNGKMDPK